jgi:hypothetical protein
MAAIQEGDCRDRQHECRAEVFKRINSVQECASKKVERSAFRWTLGIVIAVVMAVVGACYALAFSAISGNHETQKAVVRIEQKQEHMDMRQEEMHQDIKDIKDRLPPR